MPCTKEKARDYLAMHTILWGKINKLLEEEKVKIHERGVQGHKRDT